MTFETVEYSVDGAVATIAMDRPDALNALSLQLTQDLEAAFKQAQGDGVRAIVFTGNGRAFCSGGDLREMQTMWRSEGRIEAFLEEPLGALHGVIKQMRETPIPIVGAVNGVCAGAGVNFALACDVVCTVTPGHETVIAARSLRPGQHLNVLGADGPGKAEAEVEAIRRIAAEGRIFCDEWQQASHGGELTTAVAQGIIGPDDVTDLGAVCAGLAAGRKSPDEITLFDSTGLAIQDLAIVLGALEAVEAGVVKPPTVEL